MPAGVAEDLAEEFAGAVDHLGLVGEVRVRGDEADHFDHALHPVERAQCCAQRGEAVQDAHAGAGLAGGDVDAGAELAGGDQGGVAGPGELAGDPGQAAFDNDGDVGVKRRLGGRQFDAEFPEAGFVAHGAGLSRLG